MMEFVGNTGKMVNCAVCETSCSSNKNLDCGHIIRDLKNELRKNWLEKINIPKHRSCLKFHVRNHKDILNKCTDVPGSLSTEETNNLIASVPPIDIPEEHLLQIGEEMYFNTSEIPEHTKIKVEEDELISSDIPEEMENEVEEDELISSEIPQEMKIDIEEHELTLLEIPKEMKIELEEGKLISSEISEGIKIKVEDELILSEIPQEIKIKKEDELFLFDELDAEDECEEAESSDSGNDYEPDEVKGKTKKDYISLDYKRMVVNLAKKYPKWSLKSLQRKGAHRLKSKRTIKRWEEQIKTGGSTIDKFYTIDSLTYDRLVDARKCNQPVTTENVQQWAILAASQFPDLAFKASDRWVKRFKQKYRLCQRKTTKLTSEKEAAIVDETLAAAQNSCNT